MSTKMLIAGGDSFTADNIKWKAWPKFLCNIGEFDEFINVAKGGAGNEWIFNSVYDAIQKYRDDYEITVVVLWSDLQRINFFDTGNKSLMSEYELLSFDTVKWHDHIEETSHLSQIVMDVCRTQIQYNDAKQMYSNMLTYSYRRLHFLEEYCKLLNIKLYHGCIFDMQNGINVAKNISRSFTVYDTEILEPNFVKYKKQLEDSKIFMGFDFDVASYIEETGLIISEHNTHPNEEGHIHLAHMIYKFMRDGIRPKLKSERRPTRKFIYE